MTKRLTGTLLEADWHLTLYLGDSIDKLYLEGHCYVAMGSKKSKGLRELPKFQKDLTMYPAKRLLPGNRKHLEPHEILAGLTIADADVQVYWGMNGCCGYE